MSLKSNRPQRNKNFVKAFSLILFFLLSGLLYTYLTYTKKIAKEQIIQHVWYEKLAISVDDVDNINSDYQSEFSVPLKELQSNIKLLKNAITSNKVNGCSIQVTLSGSWRQRVDLPPVSDLHFGAGVTVDEKVDEKVDKSKTSNEFKSSEYKECQGDIFGSFFNEMLKIGSQVQRKSGIEEADDYTGKELLLFNTYSESAKKHFFRNSKKSKFLKDWENVKISSIYLVRNKDNESKVLLYPYFNHDSFKGYNYKTRPWWKDILKDEYKRAGITSPYRDRDVNGNTNLVRTFWYKFQDNNTEYFLLVDLFYDSLNNLEQNIFVKNIGKFEVGFIIIFSIIATIVLAQSDLEQIEIKVSFLKGILNDKVQILQGWLNRN